MQKRSLCLIACFLFCVNAFAQQYPFVHYTPKDGLVNSRIRKAFQDSKGRMYFMTYGGLSVYDGVRFKNYTTQNGLLNDLVNDILEVGEDSFLVAANTCGLNVLVHGEMKTLKTLPNGCHVLNQFLKSNDGKIYITSDDGLYELQDSIVKRLLPSGPFDYLGNVAEFKDLIVFGTNDLKHFTGLFLYDRKAGKVINTLAQQVVLNLKSDHQGIIWASTPAGLKNLDTLALAQGKLVLREPYRSFTDEIPLAGGTINFDAKNNLVLLTGKEIFRFRQGKPPLFIASPDPTSIIQSFFIDHEDVLWICHDGNGIYKLSNTNLQESDMFSRLNSSGIKNIKAINPSLVWASMKNHQWIQRTGSKNKVFSISPKLDITPLQNSESHLYGVYLNQLYMAPTPKENENTIHFTKIMTLADSVNFGGESVIDPNGNVILFERLNLCVFKDGKLISTYPFPFYDLIQGMYIDKNKELWVISRSKGVAIFSLHPETPSQYLKKEYQFSEEMETASPRSMVVDKNEMLWIGTRYHGLLAYEYKDGKLRKRYHLQTPNGLTDNFVTALACDDNGNLIIGTQTGLDRLVRSSDSTFRLENITKSNNIFTYIIYAWSEANASFAFSNSGVVYKVEPVTHSQESFQPQLVIEDMKVNGRSVSRSGPSLKLEYYQRNISLSVAAPTFIDEKQVKFSYRLSGNGNNQWSDTSSVADINLVNLSPGDYTLYVKAFFPSTDYSPKEETLIFEIMPPWWQTVFFRLMAASFIMGMLIVAVRLYYRIKLRRQRTLLEKRQAVERERTRIATDMHDDLGAGLSRIKFLSETIGMKKQQQLPIEEDISKIREYSHEMIDKMGEIVWALNEKNDSLSDLLSYTRAYAVEYLSQNGIDCTIEAPDIFPGDFVSGEFRRNVFLTVKEALHNIVKHAQASAVILKIETGHDLLIEIKDDGTGFDRNNFRPFSNGIMNMQKRIKEINGRFEMANEQGTTIRINVPLNT